MEAHALYVYLRLLTAALWLCPRAKLRVDSKINFSEYLKGKICIISTRLWFKRNYYVCIDPLNNVPFRLLESQRADIIKLCIPDLFSWIPRNFLFFFLLQGRHRTKKEREESRWVRFLSFFVVDEKEEEKNDGWDLISSRIIARGSLLLLFIISISRYRSRWVCESRPCHTNGRTIEWTKREKKKKKKAIILLHTRSYRRRRKGAPRHHHRGTSSDMFLMDRIHSKTTTTAKKASLLLLQ